MAVVKTKKRTKKLAPATKFFEDEEYQKGVEYQKNAEWLPANKALLDSVQLKGKWTFEVIGEDKCDMIGINTNKFGLLLKPDNSDLLGIKIDFDTFGARVAFCEKICSTEYVRRVYSGKDATHNMEEHVNKNQLPKSDTFLDRLMERPSVKDRLLALKAKFDEGMKEFQEKKRSILLTHGIAEANG